ncbi:LuxR C-terminal-related transcriptional regulator [Streptomyces sp. WI04-05B]|uniref:helix-turn-helix transcriptional regulator n=1 Tax=Streptomyces TaxID=1883 RepID=UPI0029AAB483|nr:MULTISPECIES: LuxR C-terminal-related transcriptional regulator [unclassified Streptomyces]MDX2546300.1 LuxR C-terminal-related transcriptional regulator [Streptomyces sp. WI04-05B]MDX2589247.1 LuxR C-terminal-related transcriptional regulator [Streptomyces sp. WI04-05A]
MKQVVPPARADAIPRERLRQQLRLAETRLTVVVAPAGWGKTSLLSGWASGPEEKRRIAWVSLDESDDEPVRFWSYVLTALHNAGGAISTGPLQALDATAVAPVDLALPMLLNELAASDVPHVLVLDDYHLLTDPRIHEALEYLVAYLPAALRIVIAARTDPPLPLARLRTRGDLTELRAAHLRFSPDEATALVSAVSGHDLDETAAAAVWERTEGWAAGLQLAALALRADPAKAQVDDRHLLDYFAAEVLPGLAPSHRDLLVRAAPLERLSGPLCDAALRVTGSAQVLSDLVRADLFVAALDDEQQWYRCHHLLRDVLAHEATTDPREVLGHAAAWFTEENRLDDAVHHLLRAGRDDDAAELMLHNAETWFFAHGDAASYLRFGERLPSRAVGPLLAYSLAFAAALCGDQTRVNHWLDACEVRGTAETVMTGWHSFRGAVLTVRAGFGMSDAEAAQSVALALQALELETAGDVTAHPHVPATLGGVLARDGRFDEAATLLLDMWQQRHRDSWPLWTVMAVAGMLTVSLVEADRGEECDRVLREAGPTADAVERDGREASTPGLAALRIAAGRRRYQHADTEGATVLLRRAVGLAELHPRPTTLFLGLLYLADAELACGNRSAARTALARAREVVEEEPVSAFAAQRLDQAETRLGRAGTRTAVRSGALAEELTDRELSILRALQGSATQREIGAALFLSINTVKAYNKSLYRKLCVASRQDAVTVARELGLI